MTTRLRPMTSADHAEVVALNDRHVHLTAPMDEARLAELVEAAEHADVIEVDGAFAGFVITFGAGAAYDGVHTSRGSPSTTTTSATSTAS